MADAADELARASSAFTRSDLLRRGSAAAFAVSMFGGLTDRALGVYGPLQFAHKELAGDLRIMTWAHFVPAYDQWLDGTYVKQWGEANDVEVKIDHINNALLYSTGASEVAAQSGHDLFWFISPPSSFQKQAIPMTDLVQEVSKKVGPMSRVARKSHVQPEDEAVLRVPGDVRARPRPVPAEPPPAGRREPPNTWDDLRQGAPKLKQLGHPVGLGMSNEIDSNMLLTSLLYCYGGFIQNEENRIVIGQGSNRKGAIEALQLMKDIYTNGMSDEVFAWTAASNNQAFLAGRLSVALNAISIVRSAEDSGNQDLSDDTWLASIPRGPVQRLGNEHVMGVFVIWKFSKNKEAAQKYLVDQQLNYRDHFVRSNSTTSRLGPVPSRAASRPSAHWRPADTHKPQGQVLDPHDDRREVHDEPGPSRQHDAGDGRDLQHVSDPADVRAGRAGKVIPCRRRRELREQGAGHLPEVAKPEAGVASSPMRSRGRAHARPRSANPRRAVALCEVDGDAQVVRHGRRRGDDRVPGLDQSAEIARTIPPGSRASARPLQSVSPCGARRRRRRGAGGGPGGPCERRRVHGRVVSDAAWHRRPVVLSPGRVEARNRLPAVRLRGRRR